MREFIKNYYGYFGILLCVISFLHWLVPFNAITLFFAHGTFVFGSILFFDYLNFRFENDSLLKRLLNRKESINIIKIFVITGIIFGLVLEFYMHWIGKFWFYPYWSRLVYFILFIPGFIGYTFYLAENYFGTRAVINKLLPEQKNDAFLHKDKLFKFISSSSLFILVTTTIYLLINLPYVNVEELLSVNSAPALTKKLFIPLVLSCFSVCIFTDSLLYFKRKRSIIFSWIGGKYGMILAILLSAWITGFIWEFFNSKAFYWHYANVTGQEFIIFGAPFFVLLFWPVQYFGILTLYYIFAKDKK